MLEALHEFIEVNRTDIFAFIENRRRPISLQYDNNIFEKMLRFLVTGFPICHCDPPQPMHAEFDKIHYEVAIVILEVFWCGCLPQMKENRQAYSSGTTDTLRQVLIEAFDSGRRYAPIEEARRTGSPRGYLYFISMVAIAISGSEDYINRLYQDHIRLIMKEVIHMGKKPVITAVPSQGPDGSTTIVDEGENTFL